MLYALTCTPQRVSLNALLFFVCLFVCLLCCCVYLLLLLFFLIVTVNILWYTHTFLITSSYTPGFAICQSSHTIKTLYTLGDFQVCCCEVYGDWRGPDSTKYMLNIRPCLSSIKPNRTRHLLNVNYTLMCFMDWGLDYSFDYN